MKKRIGIILILIGAVLITSALLLLAYNTHENRKAQEAAQKVLINIQTILEQKDQITETNVDEIKNKEDEELFSETYATETEHETVSHDDEMTVVEIDGNEYIGFISIHSLDIELPVMADWSYEKLKIAPCRQFGSTKTDDLVIAAHNYRAQFADLYKLKKGSIVVFTDMDNVMIHYTVETTNYLDPTAVEKVQNSKYDLVLYTCTYTGDTRVAVFCNRMSKISREG